MSSTLTSHCGQCGYLLPPGSARCPNCGAPVAAPQPQGATPPSSQPSEYFPGLAGEVDSADTIVRVNPEGNLENHPPEAVAPSSPPSGIGAPPLPGQSGPTAPQSVPPVSGY